ncbi:MAG: UDP-N-acetylmuramate--L-alanine ligase [Caldilineales bacterium]
MTETTQTAAGSSIDARLAALLANPAGTHVHLMGIGGAGLSAIARVLLQRGFRVTGCDRQDSAVLDELRQLGAVVLVGHSAQHVADADLLLVTSAVAPDHPEPAAARRAGVLVVKREHILAPLMAGQQAICVAGTHGKTTTSAMIATILDGLGAEPGFIVGSAILSLGTSARTGRAAGPFVIEADEYDHTFLGLQPDIAVVTNIEWDHVDCYPNFVSYQQAFADFAALTTAGGAVVYCADDQGAAGLRRALPDLDARWISYSSREAATWQATAIAANTSGGQDFDVLHEGAFVGRVTLSLAGEHNVLNLLAALAVCAEAGYDVFTHAAKNLKILRKTTGTSRRLEIIGESCDIILVDDYAHHPTEVRATLSAARQRFPRRALWVLFQPHTYSRTQALLTEFCNSFENADHVLITDIYAARERDTLGVTASDLVRVLSSHPDARYAGSLDAATATLLAELRAGDVLLTLGAGDGDQVGRRVMAGLQARAAAAEPASLPERIEGLASAIAQQTGLAVRRDEMLANHTTMRIGGPADLFIIVNETDQLVTALKLAREWSVPATLLGGGSNALFSDAGVRGLVIANACRSVAQHEGQVVWVESGDNLAGLARQAMRWGLSGLEWCVSVPGTVGGAVVGNAGAHGGSVADNLLRATVLNPDGSLSEWPAARFRYGYRTSALKTMLRSGQPAPVVLSAAFQLESGDQAAMEARAAGFLAHRRSTQPTDPSAGSIFQNPPGDYAGRILESLGLKGHTVGGAQFSTVHANFIVNLGGATAADVLALIDLARSRAWASLGVTLTPEILFLGDWATQPPYQPLTEQAS